MDEKVDREMKQKTKIRKKERDKEKNKEIRLHQITFDQIKFTLTGPLIIEPKCVSTKIL